MLDDNNVLRQRDPSDALGIAAEQYQQAIFPIEVINPEHDQRDITGVVVAGMGGSALAASLAKAWLEPEMTIPMEIVRTYNLPGYVKRSTLVVVSSYSGNTEEVLSCLAQAQAVGAQIAIVTAGGALRAVASNEDIAHTVLPSGLQPRMATIYQLRALVAILAHFGATSFDSFGEIAATSDWLREQTEAWLPTVGTERNYAKQLALQAIGKTPVFYAGHVMAPVAYKWKISLNETSKNVAFCNEYPEFNHNEFMGWTSHPVEKPYAVFDLISSFEHPQIIKRFEISDRLLSGRRPKAQTITLQGSTIVAQMLWGCILSDFVSIYAAVLNGVDPTPVALIEKLKVELS